MRKDFFYKKKGLNNKPLKKEKEQERQEKTSRFILEHTRTRGLNV